MKSKWMMSNQLAGRLTVGEDKEKKKEKNQRN